MQLKDADETEIGERGINLSGGQKARISLARAVYSDADIVFLDDPLSAVDANVGVMLFERCILGALATKTCIFVTHHTHVLPRCDRTVVLKEGRIAACGGPAELQAGGIDLIQEADTSENVIAEDAPGGVADAAGGLKSKSKSEKGALVTEEDRATGEVGWEHYHQYVRDGGRLRFSRAIISMLLGRALEVLAAFWVARWALVEEREGRSQTRGKRTSCASTRSGGWWPFSPTVAAAYRSASTGWSSRRNCTRRCSDASCAFRCDSSTRRQSGASSIASPPTRPCWIRRCPASSARAPGRPPS